MSTDLARITHPSTESLGGAFFRKAYEMARGADEETKKADRETLLGCMLSVARERAMDLLAPEGQQASMSLVGAFLSLGLEEAAESDLNRAVSFLKRTPLIRFVKVGETLHKEEKNRASRILREQVLVYHEGVYGILEPGLETTLRHAAQRETIWISREEYRAIRERCDFAERLISLAKQFPIALIMNCGDPLAEFHRQAYRRPGINEPSEAGSVLGLFIRTFFLRVLTEPEASVSRLPYFPDLNLNNAFITRNFTCDVERIRGIVGDLFFDPKEIQRRLPKAIRALDVYLAEDDYVAQNLLRVFSKKAATEPIKATARAFAKEIFLRFAESVREFFRGSDKSEVNEEDVFRFWSTHIFLLTERSGAGLSTSIAVSATGTNQIESLTLIPPKDLEKRLMSMPKWSTEAKETFLTAYPWRSVFRSDMGDRDIFRLMNAAAVVVSPDAIRRMALNMPKPLAFWFNAWDDTESQEMSDGILDAIRHGCLANKITAGAIPHAVPSVVKSRDARLIAYCLEESARRQEDASYLSRIGANAWGWLLYRYLISPDALRIIYKYIPPEMREHIFSGLGAMEQNSLSAALAKVLQETS